MPQSGSDKEPLEKLSFLCFKMSALIIVACRQLFHFATRAQQHQFSGVADNILPSFLRHATRGFIADPDNPCNIFDEHPLR